MAHEINRVTNQQVLDALRLRFGLQFPPDFNLAGAQNSEFAQRIFDHLRATGQQYPSDVLSAGVTTAKDLELVNQKTDWSADEKFLRTLHALGIDEDTTKRIYEEAKNDPANRGGINQGGKEVSDLAWQTATRRVLGDTPVVQEAERRAGFVSPTPTSAPAAPALPPAAPASVTMGAPRSRATPGVAAKETPSAALKPLATPGGAAGGGGGGANNQPAPPSTWNDDQIRDFIKGNFGSNAYFVDIPEVWDALKNVVKSGKGINGLQAALETTSFWRQSKVSARSWYVKERADPAQAAADVAQQGQAIQALADQAGITVDPDRVQAMAQSYLRYGWTNTDLQRAIAAEWHYDPTTKNQAAAVSKMKQDARNWLVPLSDQAIQTWGQGLIAGTTTDANWQQYLRDNAKSLFPQLTNMIDAHAGDANFTIDTFVNPYKQQAANLLGMNTDEIDMSDPKWRRALDVVDPKTNTRRIMSLDEWGSNLKTDAQYGYDKTKNGVNEALNLANNMKTALGF